MKDRYAEMEEALVGTGESRSERQARELAELKRMRQWQPPTPPAPTPHSDSLDLEAIRAVLDGTTADTVDRGGILWLLSTCAALLSRLEAAEREALYHRTVVGTDIVLPIHHSAYVPVLEAEISRLRSENARMTEVLKAALKNHNWHWFSDCELCIALRPFRTDPRDAARASRTQSPTQSRRRTMKRRVRQVRQSPMNEKVWNLDLDCGHDVWITSKSRPTRQAAECHKCAASPDANREENTPDA